MILKYHPSQLNPGLLELNIKLKFMRNNITKEISFNLSLEFWSYIESSWVKWIFNGNDDFGFDLGQTGTWRIIFIETHYKIQDHLQLEVHTDQFQFGFILELIYPLVYFHFHINSKINHLSIRLN
jgi:hypothetical protein